MAKGSRTQRVRRRAPGRRNRASNNCVVSGHEEMDLVVTGSSAFSGGVIPLLPSTNTTSRLSQLSLCFSQFSIVRSSFTYVPQVGSNINGRIAMAFAFDTRDQQPDDLLTIIQMSKSVYGTLWRKHTCVMPPRSSEKRRYATITPNALISLTPAEQQIYVPATLVFGTDSSTNGLAVGSIIWNYTIKFYNPNMPTLDISTSTGLLANFKVESDDESEGESQPSTNQLSRSK